MVTTTIADFASTNKPFQIATLPSSPQVGDAIAIEITSQDDWLLTSVYGALSNKKVVAAKVYSESIALGGSDEVTVTAPIDRIDSATAQTHLVDGASQAINFSAGSNILSKVVAKNSTAFIDKTGLYGTVKMGYTSYRSLQWIHGAFNAPGEYVLFAKNLTTNETQKVVINVSDGAASQSNVPTLVTIHAKDFCTDLPIAGAGVYVDNVYKGDADVNGKLVVGVLNPGSYALRIQASGYEDTSVDDLSNDSFTI